MASERFAQIWSTRMMSGEYIVCVRDLVCEHRCKLLNLACLPVNSLVTDEQWLTPLVSVDLSPSKYPGVVQPACAHTHDVRRL